MSPLEKLSPPSPRAAIGLATGPRTVIVMGAISR